MSKQFATAKRKYVRIDPSTWTEIEALWEAGDMTLRDLELRFGLSRRALQAHFSKQKVIKGAKAAEMAAVVRDKVFSQVLPEVDETLARAKATREAAYRNAVVVEELIMSQLSAAQKDPSQALKAASALKALSLAAAGLERIHQLKWRALGLDKTSVEHDELPVLVFQDLTEKEILAMQDQDQDDDSDQEGLDDQDAEEEDLVIVDVTEPDRSHRVLPDGTRMVRGAS